MPLYTNITNTLVFRHESEIHYRITGRERIRTIDNWEHLENFEVNLIDSGGTALTLLETKDSTKGMDFIVSAGKEYERLMNFTVFAEALLEKGKVPDDFLSTVAAYK